MIYDYFFDYLFLCRARASTAADSLPPPPLSSTVWTHGWPLSGSLSVCDTVSLEIFSHFVKSAVFLFCFLVFDSNLFFLGLKLPKILSEFNSR